MSYGFLVELVNNTASTIKLGARVQDPGDWASETSDRPDKDFEGLQLAPFSRRTFHEERANYRSSAPFTVTAEAEDGTSFSFRLDGCDAENLAHDGEVLNQLGSVHYAVYQMTSHPSEVGAGDGSYYRMTIFITERISPRSWMGRLIARKPDVTVPEITMPGTHESGTAGGNGEMGTRCQGLTIKAQLEHGVRYFDLRVRPYESENDLGIFHANYSQYLWLGREVLPAVSQFLVENPDECVILMFNRAVDGDASYDTLLHDLLLGNPSKGIPQGVATNKLYDRDDATSLKLADLKGCVIVLRRDPEATFGIQLRDMKEDQADQTICAGNINMRIQDAYEYSQSAGSYIAEAKWTNVKAMLDAARSRAASPTTWFVNFTSASHSPPTLGGYPWDIASGAWGVNARLARYLVGADGAGQVGSVLVDYVETPADGMVSRLLIAQNDRL